MKNILITGITGQDGLFLTAEILKKQPDYKIYGVSRKQDSVTFYRKLNSITKLETNNIELISTDLTDFEQTKKLLQTIHPSYVYNLSGPSSVYDSLITPEKSFLTITKIFSNLTNALIGESNFCNFFQASSSEMFGLELNKPLEENTPFVPNSPYAKAKLENHNKTQALSKSHNWNIYSGIMFNHESQFREDSYLFMKIINEAIKIKNHQSNALILGSLNYTRDWSYAQDISEGIFKITTEGSSNAYILGSGIGHKIKDVVEIVFEAFNLNFEEYLKIDESLIRDGDPEKIVSNPSKIKEELNWSTKVSFDELIEICINSRL
jgi:GDPmannose 4,6-dehydratase